MSLSPFTHEASMILVSQFLTCMKLVSQFLWATPILPILGAKTYIKQKWIPNFFWWMFFYIFHYLNQRMNERTCFQANKDPLFVCLFERQAEQMWVWKGCLQVRKVSHHAPLKIIQSNQFNLLCLTNFYYYRQILIKHHEHYKRIHFEFVPYVSNSWISC